MPRLVQFPKGSFDWAVAFVRAEQLIVLPWEDQREPHLLPEVAVSLRRDERCTVHSVNQAGLQQPHRAVDLVVYRPAGSAGPSAGRRLRLGGKRKPAGCD